MSDSNYTFIVGGEQFILTMEQLASEPGNHLLKLLDKKNQAYIQAEPTLFKFIQAHLRGYEILPIPDASVPVYMTKDTMITNLLYEAERYQLHRLSTKIKEHQNTRPRSQDAVRKKYKLCHWRNNIWEVCEIAEIGFNAFLDKFNGSPTCRPGIHGAPQLAGYLIVGSWIDSSYGKEDNWVVLYESTS